MKGLYLDFENFQKTYITGAVQGLGSDVNDILKPEGFNPAEIFGDVSSFAGSPLNTAQELTPQPNPILPPTVANPSTEVLNGISDKLSEVIFKMGSFGANPSPVSTLTKSTNPLAVTSESVKIDFPKVVELGIKDMTALEGMLTKLTKAAAIEKTESSGITTGTIAPEEKLTATPVSTQTSANPVSLEVFTKALAQQEAQLILDIEGATESGTLDNMFGEPVKSSKDLESKYENAITTAIEKNAESQKEINLSVLPGLGSPTLPSPVNSPLVINKEVPPQNFNKELANSLNAFATTNSQMIAQNTIVNQTTAVAQPSAPTPVPENKTIQLTGGPAPEQETEAPVQQSFSTDPLLSTAMIQMLNLMKSGQLKVKIS